MAEFNTNLEKVNIDEVNVKNVVGVEQPSVDEVISQQFLNIFDRLDAIQKNYKDADKNLQKELLNIYNELLNLINENRSKIGTNENSINELKNLFTKLELYVNEKISLICSNLNNKGSETLPVYIDRSGVATPIKSYEGVSENANHLTTNGGSVEVPVYFEDGIPKVCNYNLRELTNEKVTTSNATVTNLISTNINAENINATNASVTNLTSTTQALGNVSTKVATTQFVYNSIGSSGPVFQNGLLRFPNGNLLWIG